MHAMASTTVVLLNKQTVPNLQCYQAFAMSDTKVSLLDTFGEMVRMCGTLKAQCNKHNMDVKSQVCFTQNLNS